MESQSYVTFQKRLTNDSELTPEEIDRTKRKVKLISKMYTQQNTDHHPCNAKSGILKGLFMKHNQGREEGRGEHLSYDSIQVERKTLILAL